MIAIHDLHQAFCYHWHHGEMKKKKRCWSLLHPICVLSVCLSLFSFLLQLEVCSNGRPINCCCCARVATACLSRRSLPVLYEGPTVSIISEACASCVCYFNCIL